LCGIAGYVGPESKRERAAEIAEGMIRTIAHRGPDDGGVWIDEKARVALGNRRLAIVDLSPEGHQPMESADGRYVITYNGEVYNFEELRNQLEHLGHGFRGRSDTEVILAAVVRWGLQASLKRFVGMFAFALWDRHDERLHLARDRIGKKPLYYGWFGDTFVFGSELKCLRAHPRFRADVDRNVLALYLSASYIPAPDTIYEGVSKLPPGTFMSVGLGGHAASRAPASYWSARRAAEDGVADPLDLSEPEAIDAFDQVLLDAVRIRMRADVPLGAFLSGGIDSSTVVAAMQAQAHRPVRTFTIGFSQTDMNEAEYAKAVAAHLGTDHTELYVSDRDALSVVPRLATIFDEPLADPSAIPTLLLAELTRRHVTVSLSGDGGDELFGGYEHHHLVAKLWRWTRAVPGPARALAANGLGRVHAETWDRMSAALRPILPKKLRHRHPGPVLYRAGLAMKERDPEAFGRGVFAHWTDAGPLVIGSDAPPLALTHRDQWADLHDPIHKLMFLDLVTFLPDDIMVKVDRATMAASLEARAPLLDHRLVEFCWRLPISMKVRDGEGKHLLRQVLYRYVPRAMVDRPKKGFGAPIAGWLRGGLRDWADSLLDRRRLLDEGFFRPDPIVRRWAEHRAGRRDWSSPLWDVLTFQAWLEAQRLDPRWSDAPGPTPVHR
jgi:asparagine synthase (glutamine-hydrolysing)